MQNIILAFMAIVMMMGVLTLIDIRDQKFQEWVVKYEVCVQEHYQMTPTEWYAEQGFYPECDVTK
jgi:hypothetical protein